MFPKPRFSGALELRGGGRGSRGAPPPPPGGDPLWGVSAPQECTAVPNPSLGTIPHFSTNESTQTWTPKQAKQTRLIQFLDWGVEAARDLRQPDFLPLIATALSSLDSGVWESLLHDSTSPKSLMQRIRDKVLSRGLGVVGHIPIPADIWERYVPESLASVASRHFSGVGPPSDEAVVMLHALRSQNLLFPIPPGSPGPNGGVFAIPKTLDKCSLIVNLVPVNREMPEKPEKFSMPSVEVLALLAQVAQQGSSFFLPPLYSRARCLRPIWEVLGLPGGGGG